MKKLFFSITLALLITAPLDTPQARVTGLCVNCHTMHYSQGGEQLSEWGSSGPYNSLTTNTCVGCHTATDGATWKDSTTGAPIVNNTSAPNYGATMGDGKYAGLAAGNFYWVGQGDSYGHNPFSDNPENIINPVTAPGNNRGCDNDSCHINLHAPYTTGSTDAHLVGRSGCLSCHLVSGDGAGVSITNTWHHADDGPSGTAYVVNSAAQGWYRFLSGHNLGVNRGVSGIEDPNWEQNPDQNNHNEYLAGSGNYEKKRGLRDVGNGMTGFCVGCHGDFHYQCIYTSGPVHHDYYYRWVRHPSDYVVPNDYEYASMSTTYNPNLPVGRPSLTAVSPTVAPGTDLVMCLTCHRAHASPYADMLRWDYQNADDLTSAWGCLQCHTEK